MSAIPTAVLEKAWDDNGQCNSCGWHSAYYEVEDQMPTDTEYLENDGSYWISCTSKDDPDNDHRGCTIYPKMVSA